VIEIKDLKLNNYKINTNISEKENVGIYSPNNKLTIQLLLDLAGINKTNNIFANGENVYDNENYFKSRIYILGNKTYLNNFYATNVVEYTLKSYGKVLKDKKFAKLIRLSRVRYITNINNSYKYTKETLALVNAFYAYSIIGNRILVNPLENIVREDYMKQVRAEIITEKNTIFGITDLKKYDGLLDKLILLLPSTYLVLTDMMQKFIVSLDAIEGYTEIYKGKFYIYLEDRKVNKALKVVSLTELGEYI